MCRRLPLTVLTLAISALGCDGNPVQPTALPGGVSGAPPSSSGSPSPPLVTVTITGRVLDERGNGVAGATVLTFGTGNTRAQSDGDGRYRMDVPEGSRLVEARVDHPGYERHERYLNLVAAPQNFLLRDIIRMVPGESLQLSVTPDDSLYGFDLEFRRRTVRVTAPTHMQVEFEAVPDNPQFFEGIAVGVMPTYPCCSSRQIVTLPAGQEVSVHGLMGWGATQPRTFTLTSRTLQ